MTMKVGAGSQGKWRRRPGPKRMAGGGEKEHFYERRSGDACRALPAGYRRREPEKSVLYSVVRENLANFTAELLETDERGLPSYVERELTRYLSCGILSEGLARVRCEGCGNDFLVAFSCKNRGICPSCTARRAHEVAAHLVEHVLPRAPVRQWVLSFPRRVRWHLGNDSDLLASSLRILLRAVFTFHRRRARRLGVRAPECGSITFIQRFGSALQFNVHFHVLVPDGVFTQVERGAPVEFVELPPPSDEDVAELLSCVAGRVMRLLVRRGRLDEDAVPKDALETLKGASIQARLPLPPDWAPSTPPRKRRCASQDGVSLHANVRIHGNDRQGLEQLCLYAARGPIALERLEQREDGRVAYRMRRPAPDGSTHLVLTPV
ncbi:MAG: transposase zinc-binding domain-containing protein, partial [Myxococcaceae bacterium]